MYHVRIPLGEAFHEIDTAARQSSFEDATASYLAARGIKMIRPIFWGSYIYGKVRSAADRRALESVGVEPWTSDTEFAPPRRA